MERRARRIRLATMGGLALLGAAAFLALLRYGSERDRADRPRFETVRNQAGQRIEVRVKRRRISAEALPKQILPPARPRPGAPPGPDDSSRALDARALQSWRDGDVRGALALLAQAVAADPEDPQPRSHYGRLLLLMGDVRHARAQLERAAELAPEDPQVWLDLESVYERGLLLERAAAARSRAERLAQGRRIERDARGLWTLEGEPSTP